MKQIHYLPVGAGQIDILDVDTGTGQVHGAVRSPRGHICQAAYGEHGRHRIGTIGLKSGDANVTGGDEASHPKNQGLIPPAGGLGGIQVIAVSLLPHVQAAGPDRVRTVHVAVGSLHSSEQTAGDVIRNLNRGRRTVRSFHGIAGRAVATCHCTACQIPRSGIGVRTFAERNHCRFPPSRCGAQESKERHYT